jgi:hypothetical protein
MHALLGTEKSADEHALWARILLEVHRGLVPEQTRMPAMPAGHQPEPAFASVQLRLMDGIRDE